MGTDDPERLRGIDAVTTLRRARKAWRPGNPWPLLIAGDLPVEALDPEILPVARRCDGQEILRQKRWDLGFTTLSDSVLLEEFEHYYGEDDQEHAHAADRLMILGDEDDDEMERADIASEDSEYEREDSDDDDDLDVSDAGGDADDEDELPVEPEPLDPWGQMLAMPEFTAGDPGQTTLQLAQLPIEEPWQSALCLSPPPTAAVARAEWAAILRYWQTQRKAELLCVTPQRVFLRCDLLPSSRKDARWLAEEHLAIENRRADAAGRLILRRRLRFLARSHLWVLPAHDSSSAQDD